MQLTCRVQSGIHKSETIYRYTPALSKQSSFLMGGMKHMHAVEVQIGPDGPALFSIRALLNPALTQ